jgi:co-chaperonin GroES (HSP10)
VPDWSFADHALIDNEKEVIRGQVKKSMEGDAESLKALMQYNQFLKLKDIQKGDKIFISKYVGIDFHDNSGSGDLTVVGLDDIIGVIKDDNQPKQSEE